MKAARALQAARLVLYDHLVSKGALKLVGAEAELIYVGKESGHHTLPQEGIIEMMVRLARSGRRVLRLKGRRPLHLRPRRRSTRPGSGWRALRSSPRHQRRAGRGTAPRHAADAPRPRRVACLRHRPPAR